MVELKRIQITDPSNYCNITKECIRLETTPEYEGFVEVSLEEAYEGSQEGFIDAAYAVYVSGTMVGFIMYGFVKAEDDVYGEDCYNIWRVMIDKNHQRKGYAKQAVAKVLEEIKTMPYGKVPHVYTSYNPNNTASRNLFASLGFEETGRFDDDEPIARLKI